MKTPRSKRAFTRFAAVLSVLVLASFSSFAQQPERNTRATAQSEEAVNTLTQELGLNTSQVELMKTTLGSGPRPVVLWDLSAQLEPTLSDAQKATLFARAGRTAETERRTRASRTERADRAGRTERAGRPDRAERAEGSERDGRDYRAAERAARNRALGLSEAQSTQLDDLLEQHRADIVGGAARARAPSDESADIIGPPSISGASSEISTFLTADQQEIFRLHQALRARMQGSRSR